MSKVKYQRRAELIAGNYHRVVSKFQRVENQNILNGVVYDPIQEDIYFYLLNTIGQSGIRECHRINRNNDNKRYRLRKRLKKMLDSGICFFITLTFTDEVLKNTSEKTRRKYVIECLDSFAERGFIGNIDFGIDDNYTHREHYHAVVGVDNIDNKDCKLWRYGSLNFEKIRVNDNSIKALPKYIIKLTNHALKDSCKQNRLIYSRKK